MFDNKQWKSGGDCSICQRRSYCKKSCAASDKAVRREIGRAMINTSNKVMKAYIAVGALSAVNEGENYNKVQ